MRREIKKIFTRLMSDCLGREIHLTDDDTIESLGGDFLDAHTLLCEMEEYFCVMAPFDALELFSMSITDIQKRLEAHQ